MRSTFKLLLVLSLLIMSAYAFKCEPLTASQKVGAVVGNLKQQIKRVIKETKGITVENITLYNCVSGLGFNIYAQE